MVVVTGVIADALSAAEADVPTIYAAPLHTARLSGLPSGHGRSISHAVIHCVVSIGLTAAFDDSERKEVCVSSVSARFVQHELGCY